VAFSYPTLVRLQIWQSYRSDDVRVPKYRENDYSIKSGTFRLSQCMWS